VQDSLDPYGYRRDRMLRQGMVDTRHVGAIGTCCERVRVPRGGSCILIFNIFTRTTTSLKRGRSTRVLSVPLTSGMHQRTESKEKYQARCIGDGVSPSRIRLPQFRRLQCLSFVGCSASVSSAAVPQFRRWWSRGRAHASNKRTGSLALARVDCSASTSDASSSSSLTLSSCVS